MGPKRDYGVENSNNWNIKISLEGLRADLSGRRGKKKCEHEDKAIEITQSEEQIEKDWIKMNKPQEPVEQHQAYHPICNWCSRGKERARGACYALNFVFQKDGEILTLSTHECDLIWN